jgi:adenosylcobyric acid synthase
MPVLMIQGTASHVGKSTLVTALCRIAANAGYRVAPFKAQNMSLNAAVTPDGGEIGRAQYTQAEAAGVVPTVRMNPILLKPTDDQRSQVIVLGRAISNERAADYYTRRDTLWPIVAESLDLLRAEHDLVIIEGAGSPAEINLAAREIVNMRVAVYADAPVILVGDIERGGVFASLYGTVALLGEAERAMVKAFVINKFRGDPALIEPGPAMLAERTGIPTLGVIPYMEIGLPEEDTLGVPADGAGGGVIDIAVVRFPHMANFDDFDPLRRERGVGVRFVDRAEQLGRPDLIVLPGTKTTIADLEWLRARGFPPALARGTPVLGICGGYQMLGQEIRDPHHVESRHDCVRGLGLLPVVTTFVPTKTTTRVHFRINATDGLFARADGERVVGYEIHNGITSERMMDGRIAGTYVHGLFDEPGVRRAILARLAAWKDVDLALGPLPPTRDAMFDALAEHVSRHCDVAAILRLAGLDCSH